LVALVPQELVATVVMVETLFCWLLLQEQLQETLLPLAAVAVLIILMLPQEGLMVVQVEVEAAVEVALLAFQEVEA
jgi:hypothetical protein